MPFKQELPPCCIVNRLLPATPKPRSSPPTIKNVVPIRTSGVQLKPTPEPTFVDVGPRGIENDCPPGITPWKFGVLLKDGW